MHDNIIKYKSNKRKILSIPSLALKCKFQFLTFFYNFTDHLEKPLINFLTNRTYLNHLKYPLFDLTSKIVLSYYKLYARFLVIVLF